MRELLAETQRGLLFSSLEIHGHEFELFKYVTEWNNAKAHWLKRSHNFLVKLIQTRSLESSESGGRTNIRGKEIDS